MLSLTKLVQTSQMLLHPRFVSVLQSASLQSRRLELNLEKLGIPPRPKRPMNPFINFLKDNRPKVLESNPKLSLVEVVKECAKKWKSADEKLKQKFSDQFLKDKKQYIAKLAQYEKSLTADQKQEIEALRRSKYKKSRKLAQMKKFRETKKPKKPNSAFFQYLSEVRENGSHGNLSPKEFVSKVANDWKALPEEKKTVYKEAYKAEFERYKQDLADWEFKMITLGNVDVVRPEALVGTAPWIKSKAKATK